MKASHKGLLMIGRFLLVFAVVAPVAFACWTFLGPQRYRAVAVVYIHPFVPPAFDRSVLAATGVRPFVSVEQYRSTALFHVAAVATTPQLATEHADAAANRMLATLAQHSGDASTLFERPQRPGHPYRPNFQGALLTIAVVSPAIGLAGIAVLVVAFVRRRKQPLNQYACA